MAGVSETLELVGWALDTALEAKEVWADKKFGLDDIDNLFRVVKGAPAAFVGADQILGEFWDYDDAERAQISALIADKLAPFGLPPEQVMAAADLILAALIANARVAQFFATLKAKSDSTV